METNVPADEASRSAHWDARYEASGVDGVSWFEPEPRLSTALIRLLGTAPDEPVIDVGGGASRLVDRLLGDGFSDLTVLDVSSTALASARNRIGDPDHVDWEHVDLLEWTPPRRWSLWHDRAVFHFLTEPEQRAAYRDLVRRSVEPSGALVVITFAEDGPTSCSGLPVRRYHPDELLAEVAPTFDEVASGHARHLTPTGAVQHLSFVAARAPAA